MSEAKLCGRLLTQLYRRGQAGEGIDIVSLSEEAGASVLASLKALTALERAGLADARRLRLTLSGLALAAAFSQRRAAGAEPRTSRPALSARDAA
jgi:hypothetical protein